MDELPISDPEPDLAQKFYEAFRVQQPPGISQRSGSHTHDRLSLPVATRVFAVRHHVEGSSVLLFLSQYQILELQLPAPILSCNFLQIIFSWFVPRNIDHLLLFVPRQEIQECHRYQLRLQV